MRHLGLRNISVNRLCISKYYSIRNTDSCRDRKKDFLWCSCLKTFLRSSRLLSSCSFLLLCSFFHGALSQTLEYFKNYWTSFSRSAFCLLLCLSVLNNGNLSRYDERLSSVFLQENIVEIF